MGILLSLEFFFCVVSGRFGKNPGKIAQTFNLIAQTLQVVHGMKFTTPVVAVAVSGDNSKLVAGFVDGTVMARNRRRDAAETISAAATHPQEEGSRRDRSRHFKGAGLHSSEPEVRTERFVRLAPYEKLLKKFSYQAALDSAIDGEDPVDLPRIDPNC